MFHTIHGNSFSIANLPSTILFDNTFEYSAQAVSVWQCFEILVCCQQSIYNFNIPFSAVLELPGKTIKNRNYKYLKATEWKRYSISTVSRDIEKLLFGNRWIDSICLSSAPCSINNSTSSLLPEFRNHQKLIEISWKCKNSSTIIQTIETGEM